VSQFYDTWQTPLGAFAVAVNGAGAVVATAFGGVAELSRMRGVRELTLAPERARAARAQIDEYFAGERECFDLPLAANGTPFQLRVWDALKTIAYGETRGYGWLAQQVGSGPRAVGGANASNPISVIVPCHRVIGADGSLTGFGWGVDVKRALIALEKRTKVS
jgi:methylated-DNA-[protein]-cysteine S-methyltransferase